MATDMRLEGIHHVTCITGDAPRNVDFYTRVLGLRLVKKTVNQDDPTVYHLFYADEAGQPGQRHHLLRVPGRPPRASRAPGWCTPSAGGSGSEDALDFWERAPRPRGRARRAGRRRALRFDDPEGLRHELAVVDDGRRAARRRASRRSRAELALQGFDGVRAFSAEPDASRALLEEALGFEPVRGETRGRRAARRRGGLYAYDDPPAERGVRRRRHRPPRRLGLDDGGPRGVARARRRRRRCSRPRSSTASGSARSTSASRAACCSRSPTLGPGFAVDEDPEHLGESLSSRPRSSTCASRSSRSSRRCRIRAQRALARR